MGILKSALAMKAGRSIFNRLSGSRGSTAGRTSAGTRGTTGARGTRGGGGGLGGLVRSFLGGGGRRRPM